ncbi:MAG: hypothetical protein M0Z94_04960 [Dehalococcoidales bacterium]|nr:hypothetical protein [Dehalococcoidales bacterium]
MAEKEVWKYRRLGAALFKMACAPVRHVAVITGARRLTANISLDHGITGSRTMSKFGSAFLTAEETVDTFCDKRDDILAEEEYRRRST